MARAQVRDYLADQRTITVGDAEDEDPLQIVYRPSRRTPDFARRYNDILKENDAHKLWIFSICSLVTAWNMRGPLTVERPKKDKKGKEIVDAYGVPTYENHTVVNDGQKIPITSDVLQHMDTNDLANICRAIFEDLSVDPSTGNGSAGQ